MSELETGFIDLTKRALNDSEGIKRAEQKVSYKTGALDTVDALPIALRNPKKSFVFEIFDPRIEIGGRYRPRDFYVVAVEPLEGGYVYSVIPVANNELVSRDFMVESARTNHTTPPEISLVSFCVNVVPITAIDVFGETK